MKEKKWHVCCHYHVTHSRSACWDYDCHSRPHPIAFPPPCTISILILGCVTEIMCRSYSFIYFLDGGGVGGGWGLRRLFRCAAGNGGADVKINTAHPVGQRAADQIWQTTRRCTRRCLKCAQIRQRRAAFFRRYIGIKVMDPWPLPHYGRNAQTCSTRGQTISRSRTYSTN